MIKNITIKTVSPVHVGGKTQELTPMEAVVTGGNCYVVDETLLGAELLAKKRLDSLAFEISRQGPRFELGGYLKGLGFLNKNFLDKVSIYRCQTPLTKTPGRLRPFVRDAYGQPFAPGSSIKGFIRTAIMYSILKKMKSQQSHQFELFVESIKRKLNEYLRAEDWQRSKPAFKDSIKRNMAAQIENELMQKFNLPVPVSGGRGPTGPNRDFMRVLKVSDSTALSKEALTLQEVQILSLTGTGKEVYLKTPLYAEVIPPGAELSFSVTLDEPLLETFARQNKGNVPFESLRDVMQMIEDFARDIWGYEKDYWQKLTGPGVRNMRDFYSSSPAGWRIGWGSGLVGASLLMLLPVDLAREIRDALFMPRGDAAFPKSRRAVMEDGIPRWPLGWMTVI